jgi:2-polyprenyl-6-methoxyphenol hydroxylase-like FAD-dependent oxidoreductase
MANFHSMDPLDCGLPSFPSKSPDRAPATGARNVKYNAKMGKRARCFGFTLLMYTILMRRDDRTGVLVAGAGPVGMFTALRLALAGVAVQVIDQESRTAGRSFACALHPRTLQLLDEVGAAIEAVQLGRRIETVAFYEGGARCAEVKLSALPGPFPFVLVLAQSALEDLLERKLREQHGVKVHWNHRLADLQIRDGAAFAGIEEMALAGKGYIVPDFELQVKRTLSVRADFVVGADGQNSVVRQRLGIASDQVGEPELFTVYELETESALAPEMRIVLDPQTVSVLWPFAENKCRWSFQWPQADAPSEFPLKDRNRFTISESPGGNDSRHQLQQLLAVRAPWFQAGIKDAGWGTVIQFEHRLARQFGRDRAWLAGDAAHQTGPVGAQSMNLGMREAADLAARLARILGEDGPPSLLEAYNLEYRAEWEQLLGLKGGVKADPAAGAWVRERRARPLPCLPASGSELGLLLSQLGLEWERPAPHAAAGPQGAQ